MNIQKVPPAPVDVPIVNDKNKVPKAWIDWFNGLAASINKTIDNIPEGEE